MSEDQKKILESQLWGIANLLGGGKSVRTITGTIFWALSFISTIQILQVPFRKTGRVCQ